MKRKKITAILTAVLISSITVTGCGVQENESQTKDSLSDKSVSANSTTIGEARITTLDVENMFTDRDLDPTYDEKDCKEISLSDNQSTSTSNKVEIDGNTITIKSEGTYVISGSLTDGMIVVDAGDSDKVQLVLNGVNINKNNSAALYIKNADKVFLTANENTENSLTSTGDFEAIDDSNIDGVIFAKDDLTINGEGSLDLNSDTGNGAVCKNDLVLAIASIKVQAANSGITGKDSVRIAKGDISVTCNQDGIHSGNEEEEKGFTYIEDGNITVEAGDDGVHSDYELLIAGGKIDITKSYEGLEGKEIEIRGGDISVVSSDDGINAAGGNDNSGGWGNIFTAQDGVLISILDGSITINADGDGIDSNGDLYVDGGEIYVSGPTNSGNGAIDYNGVGQINGGELVALGAAGMAENFDTSSTQGAIMINTEANCEAGSTVALLDEEGSEILSYTGAKDFSNIVISSSKLEVGKTYTIKAGDSETTVELDSLIYGEGSGMGGAGMGGHGGGKLKDFDPDSVSMGDLKDFQNKKDMSDFDGSVPEMPEGMEDGEVPQMPEGMEDGEVPQMPEGMEDGEAPQKPTGDMGGNRPDASWDNSSQNNSNNQTTDTNNA